MTAAPTRKYNPGFLTDDELVASFCVRTHEFESLIESLSACTGDSNQHQIVIGPRGSGKTSLLLRVAAEVRRDADLAARFFPIVFAEESYEVSTAGEFWLECLARLAIQAPEREDAPNLHTTLADLRTIHDDRTLGERCLAALLDFADREGKRLVLMVENLNMMFRDMMDRDAGWRLRKILQNEPRIILLASATSRFDEIDHPDHALYDQFRVLTLRPLNTAECAALWETVAGQSRPTNTIRSLEILTGGSPRLLAIVARFGTGLSFRELMDSLFDLVDDHTEYFKSHLESLPTQERRVYLALADIWKPALTKEVAERARLETSKCSAQLARLIERGVVRLEGGSARRKQYYLSERMYNIYYLLRRGKGRLVDVLIRFMEAYYSPDKLNEISTRIDVEVEDVSPEMRSLYQSVSKRLKAMSAQAREDEAARSEDLVYLAEVLATRPLFESAVAFSKQGQHERALAILEELLKRYDKTSTPALQIGFARALVNKGATLGALNKQEEELVTYDEVLHRFGHSEAPDLLEPVTKSLTNKGVVLGALGRSDEALDAYDDVLRRFNDSEAVGLQESAATALVNKGALLSKLNRYDEVVFVCDEVLRRFDTRETPVLVEQVANALVEKGIALDRLNKREEALATYDEVLHHFGETEVPELRKQVTAALINKGATLGKLNRWEEELAACDEALRRLGGNDAPDFLEGMAAALTNKGGALRALNRQEEALVSCDEVLRRFADSNVSWLHVPVAKALLNKSAALGALGRSEEALAACDEMLRRFGHSDDPRLLEGVAKALNNKGVALVELGRPAESPDVVALLAVLPKLDSPNSAIHALMKFTVLLGPERMRELIQGSPAAELLVPLTTALEREMGFDPRVPEEISEVAEDIRRDLATLREARLT